MPTVDPTLRRSASAADVLGRVSPAGNAKIDARWQKHFERLTEMRERLSDRRSTQIHDAASAGEPNFAENPANRGTDEYDMGAALSLLSSEQNALYEIEQALQRIRDGAYGVCEATGQPIPEDRLEAIPWTRFAREVEAGLEKEEQARKRVTHFEA